MDDVRLEALHGDPQPIDLAANAAVTCTLRVPLEVTRTDALELCGESVGRWTRDSDRPAALDLPPADRLDVPRDPTGRRLGDVDDPHRPSSAYVEPMTCS